MEIQEYSRSKEAPKPENRRVGIEIPHQDVPRDKSLETEEKERDLLEETMSGISKADFSSEELIGTLDTLLNFAGEDALSLETAEEPEKEKIRQISLQYRKATKDMDIARIASLKKEFRSLMRSIQERE